MQLRPDDVVAGALAVLDAEGLDGLTMRAVAARLGVRAGALYWHVAGKQALLDAMAEVMVDGVVDDLPPGPWDAWLTAFARRYRAALLAHRDGARVVAGTFVAGPRTMTAAVAGVDVMVAAGVPPERALGPLVTLTHYVLGHTIEEQARADLAATGGWAAVGERAAAGLGDVHARALAAFLGQDEDERFADGLALVVEGLRRRLG